MFIESIDKQLCCLIGTVWAQRASFCLHQTQGECTRIANLSVEKKHVRIILPTVDVVTPSLDGIGIEEFGCLGILLIKSGIACSCSVKSVLRNVLKVCATPNMTLQGACTAPFLSFLSLDTSFRSRSRWGCRSAIPYRAV